MTVWIYQGKELKVFATADAAQRWFDVNDPEGVAFEYPIEGAAMPAGPVNIQSSSENSVHPPAPVIVVSGRYESHLDPPNKK